MRITIKTILISILTIISSIILFEIYSKYKISKNNTLNFDYTQLWSSYTQDELNKTLPAYHKKTGLHCMQKIRPSWHHKF